MLERAGLSHFNSLLQTPELPELGPGPRLQVRPLATVNQEIEDFLKTVRLPAANQELIRAMVLLWHDRLEAAHTIAQQIETSDGSYVHGIIHRREPDYGNARYWFWRVGKHPGFSQLAEKARAPLQSERLLELKLIVHGAWDPFAFVDACEETARHPAAGSPAQLLRAIQGIEFELLLEHLCRPAQTR